MKNLSIRNPEIKKFCSQPTAKMEELFGKTKVFTEASVPWLKGLITNLKSLMDKME